MGITSAEHGLTMEGMEEEGKKSVNCKWLNLFGPYGTPLVGSILAWQLGKKVSHVMISISQVFHRDVLPE